MDMKSYRCLILAIWNFLLQGLPFTYAQQTNLQNLPASMEQYVRNIAVDGLGMGKPSVKIHFIDPHTAYIGVSYDVPEGFRQDDWKITISPAFTPSFYWTPHLTPSDEYIVAQHVFRSPALIISNTKRRMALIPDLDLMNHQTRPEWYLDLNALRNELSIGVSKSRVKEHVLFVRDSGQRFVPPVFYFGFYLMLDDDSASIADPFRRPLEFMWNHWGRPNFEKGEPLGKDLEPYIQHTYHWAFESWKPAVWQEFSINGKKVGAPVFIVNVTQSPNYPKAVNEREFRSIWNQAWFSSLRSASGLYRYARRTGDTGLLNKAILTKELALSFPQKDGLFRSVIATPMKKDTIGGEIVNRSTGWDQFYYGNSNRNPATWDPARSPMHILDMSWTCFLMLQWYDELEKDERLISYTRKYADKLLTLQDTQGFFPAWIDEQNGRPLDILKQSPETSQSATFLFKLYALTHEKKYYESALRALEAVSRDIIPEGRWEDFETYWSCSSVFNTQVGQKIKRNNVYKQNTLSMFWTAEAFYYAYKISGQTHWLHSGQRVLDELLMFQATWQPPFIAIRALGGFGVMNSDGEWNDSRQSLFAELIIQYGRAMKREQYIQRGIAALKASFVMMYCPENAVTKVQWEKVYPFFSSKDYGFMMENYGHGGETNDNGLGIGEFTIYDWGNGAAAEAYNRILDHFGKDLIAY
jgi:hypothetical protein